MSRSDHVYLLDIVASIEIIFEYIGDKTEFEFGKDLMLLDAVTRRFEIIGEASSNISDSLKTAYPQIKWRLMKEMRNKLIHEYFGISAVTIYSTVKIDLPVLLEQIEKISI